MDNDKMCKCGDSKAWHNRKGCTANWKMGTEWCDCKKFEPKSKPITSTPNH